MSYELGMTVCSKYPRELSHYNKQLKRRFFRKLRDNVWNNKTKWQLLIKAELLHNFRLLVHSFKIWLCFTKHRIIKRKNHQLADRHYTRKLQFKGISILRRTAESQSIHVDAFRNKLKMKIKRRVWICWGKYVGKTVKWKEIKLLTMKMRHLHLMKFYIELWCMKCSDKIFYKEMHFKAETHHNSVVKRRVLYAWKKYLKHKSMKKELIYYCWKKQNMKIKERALSTFMNYTLQRRLYKNHIQCVNLFYESYLLKNVLDKWITKYDELLESRNFHKYRLADNTYEKKLLFKTFRNLRIWTKEEKKRGAAAEHFLSFSIQVKIKFYLDIWRNALRVKLFSESLDAEAVKWRNDQLKQIFLSKMVESFELIKTENEKLEKIMCLWNCNIMGKTFRRWEDFTNVKRTKKSKYEMARRHYENKIARVYTRKLEIYAANKYRKRNASEYYNERLKKQIFKKLMWNSEITRSHRMKLSALQKRREQKCLQGVFDVLKEASACAKNKFAFAKNIVDCKVKKRTFQQWKKYTETKRMAKLVENENRLVLSNVIALGVISTWWKRTQLRQTFREELKKLKLNRGKRLVRKYFLKWWRFIENCRIMKEKKIVFNERYVETILQYCIVKMSVELERKRTLQRRYELACRTGKEMTLKRTFKKWIAFVRWKNEKIKELSVKVGHPKSTSKSICPTYCYVVSPKRKRPMIPHYLRDEFYIRQMSNVWVETT